MTTEYTTKQLQLREQLSKALTIDSIEQMGVKIGKDNNNSDTVTINGSCSTDQLTIREIDRIVSGDIIDAFVYRTADDSDGGRWRERVQNTSWYNEPLGTSDRGTRKDFPSVAIIVVYRHEVVLLDADDPALPMWMKFEAADTGLNMLQASNHANRSLTGAAMLNGVLCVISGTLSDDDRGHFARICFVSDHAKLGYSGTYGGTYRGGISDRNRGLNKDNVTFDGWFWFHKGCSSVDMTYRNSSSIDPATGLLAPLIAVSHAGYTTNTPDQVGTHWGSVTVILETQKAVTWLNNTVGRLSEVKFLQAHASPSEPLGLITTGGSGIAFHGYYRHSIPTSNSDSYDGKIGNTNDSLDWSVGGTIIPRRGNRGNSNLGGYFIESDEHDTCWINEAPGTVAGLKHKLFGLTTEQKYFGDNMTLHMDSEHITGWMYGNRKHYALNTLNTDDVGDSRESLINGGGSFGVEAAAGAEMAEKYPEWFGKNAVISVNGGALTVDDTANSGGGSSANYTVDTIPGMTYKLNFKLVSVTGPNSHCNVFSNGWVNGPGDVLHTGSLSSGFNQHVFTAISYRTTISLGVGNADVAKFDAVYLRRTNEKIAQGYFDKTDYALQAWKPHPGELNKTTATITNDVLSLVPDGGDLYGILAQPVYFEAGKMYRVRVRYRNVTGSGDVGLYIGTTEAGGNDDILNYNVIRRTTNTSWVTSTVNITIDSSQAGMGAVNIYSRGAGVTGEFDMVSVMEVTKPAGDFNQGEVMIGEVMKTPVEPGASLQCYTNIGSQYGFDGINRKYNVARIESGRYADDFITGTDDFMISIWYKPMDLATNQAILSFGGELSNNGFYMYMNTEESAAHTDKRIYVDAGYLGVGGSFLGNAENGNDSGAPLVQHKWNHIVLTKTDDTFTLWTNGVKYEKSWSASGIDWSTRWQDQGARLVIGNRASTMGVYENSGATNKFAMIKVSSGGGSGAIPTGDQIRRMYADELPLFRPGAKTGLSSTGFPTGDNHHTNLTSSGYAYTDPNVVLDASFDPHTKLLHVGTGASRDTFNKLVKVEQTNNPTNLVHARGGIVTEQ